MIAVTIYVLEPQKAWGQRGTLEEVAQRKGSAIITREFRSKWRAKWYVTQLRCLLPNQQIIVPVIEPDP